MIDNVALWYDGSLVSAAAVSESHPRSDLLPICVFQAEEVALAVVCVLFIFFFCCKTLNGRLRFSEEEC